MNNISTDVLLYGFTFIIGLLIGLFIKNSEIKRLINEKKETENKNNNLQEQINLLSGEISQEKAKLELISNLEKLIKEDFTNIANQVIKSEQSDLRQQNKEAVEEKLKPLKENFEKFKEKIEEFNKQGAANTATIKTQIETLMSESFAIKNSANELTNALKANSQARGVFGEIILENLLSQSGLINKKDDDEKGNFITQTGFRDIITHENNSRPDAVVFLPDNKHIVIDSKCPLNNFLEYVNSKEEGQKEKHLEKFFNSVSDMIDNLSSKYNSLENINTPEFKLMFIPIEACAGFIYSNKELLNKSFAKNIIIVCPSTLLATLKIINRTWQQKAQTENINQIIKIASGVYDKMAVFIQKTEDLRTKFASVEKSFDGLFKTAKGKNGLIRQIDSLKEFGLTVNNEIDEKYLIEME